MTDDTATPPVKKTRNQRTPRAAAPGAAPALSAADRKFLAIGKVYAAAEAAGCSVKELVALINEGFGTEG